MSRVEKSRLYTYMVIAGIISLMLIFGMSYMQFVDKVLNYQKNIIGVLSQVDEIHVENYIEAMFEAQTPNQVNFGMEILRDYGYTEMGIHYIGKNMGILEYGYIGAAFWSISIGMLCVVYKLVKTQWKEIDELKREIYSLKQVQMKEEYVAEQNKRIQSFIENIAHQMKTPLSRVFTSLDIIDSRLKDKNLQHYIEECYQHLDGINALMKRLMDIGRLEAGKIIFQKERLKIRVLLEELKNEIGIKDERVQIDCKENLEYYGDEKWLREAFSNILCNALEADKSKEVVEVSCSQTEDYIKISIRDHGPGLSEKDIPNIFDRFYLPEDVKENHVGIGLNLAKLVLEGHKGSVYVYNHAEGGAVFQVLLPVYDTLKMR